MNPKVSVILPAFNAQDYITSGIKSILEQSMTDFELIILNDGSTDNTENKILEFTDERIQYIKNPENLGLIRTLNKGISISKGKYIARMDADDISLPQRLEAQYDFLEKNSNIGVVGTPTIFFGEIRKLKKSFSGNNRLKSMILFRNPFHHPTVMIRKNILTENKIYYDENFYLAEDYALWVKLLSFCEFDNLDKPMLLYRIHPGQETKKNLPAMNHSVLQAQKILYDKLDITPTVEEEDISIRLYTEEFKFTYEFLDNAEKWLIRLTEANQIKQVFDQDTFLQETGKIWFLICTSLASRKIKTSKKFYASPLSRFYKANLKSRIKFKLKNL